MKTVAILAGGHSTEHEISIASGRTAEKAFIEAGYDVLFVILNREGFWLNEQQVKLTDLGVDYVFNSIHGTPGEDGHISGMLEVFGIPHSTCPTFQSALTFNKNACNQLLRAAGYRVPKGQLFHSEPDPSTFNDWNFPIFVKPNRAGSSFGVTRVESATDLGQAFEYAFSEDDEVLVEEGVIGTEVGCGVLMSAVDFNTGGTREPAPEAIAITEIVPTESAFFDFKAKYEGKSQEITPARISSATAAKIEHISKSVYSHLKLAGIVRIDFIIDQSGEPTMIEINSIPGLSPASIIPQQIKYRNWELSTVLSTLAEEAMARTKKN